MVCEIDGRRVKTQGEMDGWMEVARMGGNDEWEEEIGE